MNAVLAEAIVPEQQVVPVLRVSDLSKAYGAIQAVAGVSFEVQPGEIFGVIGPNGSGKSTFFNVVSGYLRADSGAILFEG